MLANYGTEESSIDVTKEVTKLYYDAPSKPVTIGPNFNSLFGDPIVGTCKRLEITVLLPGGRFKVYTCYEINTNCNPTTNTNFQILPL